MQQQLQFIDKFSEVIASTFKNLTHIIRNELKESSHEKSYHQLQVEYLRQKKIRIQLQNQMRKMASQKNNNEFNEEKEKSKKLKNAFHLFVVDQRQKILKEQPDYDMYKITSLASLRWKKLPEEKKKQYEKKLEQINEMYESKANKPQPSTIEKKLPLINTSQPQNTNQEDAINTDKSSKVEDKAINQDNLEQMATQKVIEEKQIPQTIPMQVETEIPRKVDDLEQFFDQAQLSCPEPQKHIPIEEQSKGNRQSQQIEQSSQTEQQATGGAEFTMSRPSQIDTTLPIDQGEAQQQTQNMGQ